MLFLYPSDYFDPSEPDELWRAEYVEANNKGLSRHLADLHSPLSLPSLHGKVVVYRGWMLREVEYSLLEAAVKRAGGTLINSVEQYLATHHLPRWYPLLSEVTPKTIFFDKEVNLKEALEALQWSRYFIKDHVKSLKTGRGSIIQDPEELPYLIQEMKRTRGDIEGGYSVRAVEEFVDGSERRYFVLHGEVYGPAPLPPVLEHCKKIPSNFFSVDVALTPSGEARIVEIGDGQVSDLVGWEATTFLQLFKKGHRVE